MAVVNRFNVNREQVTLDVDIIENMSANDVSYDASVQYNENTVGDKLSELDEEVKGVSPKLFVNFGQIYKTDGTIMDFVTGASTNILPLSIFGDYKNNGVKVVSGTFRMYNTGYYCIAVFFDDSKNLIGYTQISTTISTVSPFPASEIPDNAVYVAFNGRTDVDDLSNTEFDIISKSLKEDLVEVKENNLLLNNRIDSTQEIFKGLKDELSDIPTIVNDTIEKISGKTFLTNQLLMSKVLLNLLKL